MSVHYDINLKLQVKKNFLELTEDKHSAQKPQLTALNAVLKQQ